ncbi:hypothetical protein TNCV_1816231 [Trichonephila clavipes]|nr:hypothetical protein TNCV_1816231 [Trichonephila clavipes]
MFHSMGHLSKIWTSPYCKGCFAFATPDSAPDCPALLLRKQFLFLNQYLFQLLGVPQMISGSKTSAANVVLIPPIQHDASPEDNYRTTERISSPDVTGMKPYPTSPNQLALRIAWDTEETFIREENSTPLASGHSKPRRLWPYFCTQLLEQ